MAYSSGRRLCRRLCLQPFVGKIPVSSQAEHPAYPGMDLDLERLVRVALAVYRDCYTGGEDVLRPLQSRNALFTGNSL